MISTAPPSAASKPYDVILISGDIWADHPHSGVGVIARVLEADNFSVGIIEKPDWKSMHDFQKLGLPRLFWGITSGAIDSMLVNYTPLKKSRADDPHKPFQSGIPDRAVIVYSQKVREAQKGLIEKSKNPEIPRPIILGGVEASLRRFTHYDYWDNTLRRPIIIDAKADLLVFGPGEWQIREIAQRLNHAIDNGSKSLSDELIGIDGTTVLLYSDFGGVKSQFQGKFELELLASHNELTQEKRKFCVFTLQLANWKSLAEPVENRIVLQFKMHDYTGAELDWLYSLPFTYSIPENFKEFEMARFSLITHRGCIGICNFCSITLHQGDKIISRSPESIEAEIQKMSQMPEFKGFISDLGAASADMYGMDCNNAATCHQKCIQCPRLDRSHKKVLTLMRRSRSLPGIKKVFIRSGIRYDLVSDCDDYLADLSRYHISGTLKIAPEHLVPHVCELMGKPCDQFDAFKAKFDAINKPLKQNLRYYLMAAHPGCTLQDMETLRDRLQQLGVQKPEMMESTQIFTPSPMSVSSCMYYTGLNPFTLEPVAVPYTYNEKKRQKNILYSSSKPESDSPKKLKSMRRFNS